MAAAIGTNRGTMGKLGGGDAMSERLIDQLPPGDADFDRRFGTDTSGEIPAELLGHSPETVGQAVSYEPTDPGAFRHMIRELPIEHRDYTFVDVGSGKGRTLLLAAGWPWRRIVGIEASPVLHAVAERNLRAWARAGRDARPIRLVCGDASALELPATPCVLYLFNPFHSRVMARLMLAIKSSLEAAPRDLWLIYYNPQLGYMLESATWLGRVSHGRGFQQGDYGIWRARPDPARLDGSW